MRSILIDKASAVSQPIENPAMPPGLGATVVAAPAPPAGVRRLSSRELFASAGELLIDHAGIAYRLRITRQGKLILTK